MDGDSGGAIVGGAIQKFSQRRPGGKKSRWPINGSGTLTAGNSIRTATSIVIRDVIPADVTRSAVHEIAAFVGAGLTDSRTWYSGTSA